MKSNYDMQLNRKFDWNYFDQFYKFYLTRIKGKPKWYIHDDLRYVVKVNHTGDYGYVTHFKLFSKYNTMRSYGVEK